MWISRIEASKGKRFRVYSDDTFLFALYTKELNRFHVRENMELEDTVIHCIREEIVWKRAKERALYLLERSALSTAVLKEKLRKNDYPADIVERVVEFLNQYHYLDDNAYVELYVHTYANSKSKRQIAYDLRNKGIAKEVIDACFERLEFSEEACLDRQLQKYIKGKDLQDYKVRQKVFRYFYNKGFATGLIETALKQYV